jgi:glycosyltransferase involved in cell wall biosynthesis
MTGDFEGRAMVADPAVAYEPVASFVIPVHNNGAYLDAALRSARAQTVHDLEIIVVDDGSTDGSLAIAQRHAAEDPRVRVVAQVHLGLSEARNHGLRLARAKWVALQDADDISLPARVERQLAFLREHPDVAALGTYGWRIGVDGRRLSVQDIGPRDRAHLAQICARGEAIWLNTSSTMLSRDLVLQLGGFRSMYGVAEDVELWTRLADDHLVLALPERLHEYRIHRASVSMTRFFEQMEQWLQIQVNATRRRSGEPELDLASFRSWQRSRPLPERLLRAATWRSRYCYRMAGARLIDHDPRGLLWLAAAWVVAPNVPLGRLHRQMLPWLADGPGSPLPRRGPRRLGASDPRPVLEREQPATRRMVHRGRRAGAGGGSAHVRLEHGSGWVDGDTLSNHG